MKTSTTDISFNSIDSSTVEIPLLKPSNDEEDNQHLLIRHNKTAKRVTGGLLVAIALYLLWKCWCESSDSDFEWMLPPALGGNHHYGVDYSWPIHGPIVYDDNPWYHDRHRLYLKQLEGCRAHYAKISKQAARTCDVYEYDRILMNRRQPQSMQVSLDSNHNQVSRLCFNENHTNVLLLISSYYRTIRKLGFRN